MSVQGWSGGVLPGGARFAQGFHLEYDPAIPKSYIADELEGCLYGSGGFVELQITQPTFSFFTEYWQIEGRTSEAFGQAQDLQNLIRGTVQACAVTTKIRDEFPLQIYSVPDPMLGVDLGTQQIPQVMGGAGGAGKCNFSTMNIGDYLACQLGITKTSAATLGVVAGVLGAIIVLKSIK